MPNLNNLKPYQPGESGNKAGRPVSDIRNAIREAISKPSGKHDTTLEAIIDRMIKMSMKGSIKATELLLSYAYGKPKGEAPELPSWTVIMPKAPTNREPHTTDENEI
jgi:hypothetical protein